MVGLAGGVNGGEPSAGNTPNQYPSLLPANVALLQPGSSYFRLFDALTRLDQSGSISALNSTATGLQSDVAALQTAVGTLTNQLAGINGAINTINGAINTINGQIATINARLAAAGIP